MSVQPSIIKHSGTTVPHYELCACGQWRKGDWRPGEWSDLTGIAPPYHLATPRTCPDCQEALEPTITRCSYCPAWRWYGTETWQPAGGPDLEKALASHGICPTCKEEIAVGGAR